MKRILVVNGPNLNLLGRREPAGYGDTSLDDINEELDALAEKLGLKLDLFQSNHEGILVDKIQEASASYAALIINAGALTHYSIAIHDSLKSAEIPVIEVHLSNIYQREEYRHHSFISPVATGGIFGFGKTSYKLALIAASELVNQ